MRKVNNWMVLAGILLIVGGAAGVWVTIQKNLPSPFDIASAPGEENNFLPIIAPASAGNDTGGAAQGGSPTVSAGGSYSSDGTPQPLPAGLVPDRLVIPAI